jgi:D-alanyl-D-alanine carboxypeptidase/D-alanyl-D-alanine-endopeptidase (penicillin-binding protein 4)
MRRLVLTWGAVLAALTAAPLAAEAQPTAPALSSLTSALNSGMARIGGASSAYVIDLTTGQPLYSVAAGALRLPASVEKLYTTSTALLRLGPTATLTTSVWGVGSVDVTGTWNGILYLKGGGDPTFGSQTFDRSAYGTGATMQQLVSALVRQTGITSVSGRIVGDQSWLDSRRGTPPYGYRPSADLEGLLSGLAFDRGLADPQGSAFQRRPALFAAQQFAAALRAGGVKVPSNTPVYTGRTPSDAQQLAVVQSPPMATLIRLTNTPSDNYLAEMLLKDIGAAFGGEGSTAAGAAVVRAQLASFGIRPALNDGSGLSRTDLTTPRQVVTVLERMAGNADFVNSLAIGGETGTLQDEMRGTAAQRNCVGKTGTLHDVANLAGYCTARDGHKLVFAFLMNQLADPIRGHAIEAKMAVALAKYAG